jgi:hypothetical protein
MWRLLERPEHVRIVVLAPHTTAPSHTEQQHGQDTAVEAEEHEHRRLLNDAIWCMRREDNSDNGNDGGGNNNSSSSDSSGSSDHATTTIVTTQTAGCSNDDDIELQTMLAPSSSSSAAAAATEMTPLLLLPLQEPLQPSVPPLPPTYATVLLRGVGEVDRSTTIANVNNTTSTSSNSSSRTLSSASSLFRRPSPITITEAIQIPSVTAYAVAFGFFKFVNYAMQVPATAW